ncbi:hypothetical protein [Haloarchaeobius sp. TZWSO28]|uniref:hypothetical protein n=1 Tax=Haloarchaeobius sp. TZWSO28 TaxID=3446119 RepID=UPI003EB6B37E
MASEVDADFALDSNGFRLNELQGVQWSTVLVPMADHTRCLGMTMGPSAPGGRQRPEMAR